MKRYDCIIWDFNGTILDDVAIGIESINTLLAERDLPQIRSKDEYRESFGFPIVEWYKRLGFDFDKENYDVVAKQWVSEYLSRETQAGLCDGVFAVLRKFRDEGIRQVIISASEINMLKRQVAALGVESFFDEIVGKSDIYASGKKEVAQNWRNANPGNMLFIGDTDHDLESAGAMMVDCVLVACGHQSYDRLKKFEGIGENEVIVVHNMKQLLKMF